jgi:hypothetical protein
LPTPDPDLVKAGKALIEVAVGSERAVRKRRKRRHLVQVAFHENPLYGLPRAFWRYTFKWCDPFRELGKKGSIA